MGSGGAGRGLRATSRSGRRRPAGGLGAGWGTGCRGSCGWCPSALFAGAFLLVTAADFGGGVAYPELLTAAAAVGLGECFHTCALMPLTADLAPAGRRISSLDVIVGEKGTTRDTALSAAQICHGI